MKEPFVFFFMGCSGSGKDTQAELLKDLLEKRDGRDSVLWISTGDILRDIVDKKNYAGRVIDQKIMRAGEPAPSFLVTFLWAETAVRELKESQHVIFPSSPRSLEEAQSLDEFAVFFDRRKVFPILLEVGRKEAFQRLTSRARKDDTPEIINHRLDYFERQVRPAVEYFEKESENKLVKIDGNPNDVQKIHENILKAAGLM